MSIITYGGWFNTFQRPHHFARYLTERYDTRVVNNIVGVPFRGYGYMAEQRDLVNGISNIYILKGEDRLPLIKSVNRLLIKAQSLSMLRSREFRESDLVYTWHIEDTGYLGKCRDKFLIYDAMDDWAAFFDDREQRLTDNEYEVAARADLVLAVSRKLYDRLKGVNRNTHLIPNGVDSDYFGTATTYARNENDPLYDYRNQKTVGYVGGIHDWVDVDLMVETARLLPEMLFVLIGPALKSLKPKFAGVGNIVYLGPRPYSELIRHVSYFHAGIIPFKLNLLNESTNPIKLYEYLGAGLPVISTAMPEVVCHRAEGVVHIAYGPEEFAGEIVKAVAMTDDRACRERRLKLAAENSWASRAGLLLELIEEGLAKRGVGR